MLKNVQQLCARTCRYFSTQNNYSGALNATTVNSSKVENRSNKQGPKGYTEDGGHIYHGFTYYPRNPEQVDPPYDPSKVLMVQRIRCLKKKPYWDKDVMTQLGLNNKRSTIAIVANTPAVNAMLWKVKHLIRITPVTFPQGIPSDGDVRGAKLKENGELIFVPKLKNDSTLLEVEADVKDPRVDGETMQKFLRAKWMKPWD